jgi:hypothetical protein
MENSAFRKKCCAITQIGEPDESDRAHSRTRLKYVYVHLAFCNPLATSFFSNKGKTAYVYPAFELSDLCALWPK